MTTFVQRLSQSAARPFADLEADLADLDQHALARRLQPRAGVDFASNDYLGFARSPRLARAVVEAVDRGVAVGSGGSRLLRGNDPEHEALEAEAAACFGSEAALYFASGYAANVAMFATLPQRGDLVVYDTLIHASAHEGFRLSRADAVAAGHNDPTHVEDILAAWRRRGGTGRPWIAIESLYSMDGDRAPLVDLLAIAQRHDAILVVDEAHATGVFGSSGRGLTAGLEGLGNVITLRTCGKALGCEGALVCAPQVVRDFLVNRGRGFVFTTAPSPLMASAVREALRMLADEPDRRHRLAVLIAAAGRALAPLGIAPPRSQIVPIIIGGDAKVMQIAHAVQAAGFDVRGIRPPSVPAGTSRLRISLTLNVAVEEIEQLAILLGKVIG